MIWFVTMRSLLKARQLVLLGPDTGRIEVRGHFSEVLWMRMRLCAFTFDNPLPAPPRPRPIANQSISVGDQVAELPERRRPRRSASLPADRQPRFQLVGTVSGCQQ